MASTPPGEGSCYMDGERMKSLIYISTLRLTKSRKDFQQYAGYLAHTSFFAFLAPIYRSPSNIKSCNPLTSGLHPERYFDVLVCTANTFKAGVIKLEMTV